MPKELGSNQSAGLKTVWKKENQINAIFEKKAKEQTGFEGNIMFLSKVS